MKNWFYYFKFRLNVFRRKVRKLLEFIKLYRDWVVRFDQKIQKAVKEWDKGEE